MKIKVHPAAHEKQLKIQALQAENSVTKGQIQGLRDSNCQLQKSIQLKSLGISQLKKKFQVSSIQKQLSTEQHLRKQKLVERLQKQVGSLLSTLDEYKLKRQKHEHEICVLESKLQKQDQSIATHKELLKTTDKKIQEEEYNTEKIKAKNLQVLAEIKQLRQSIMAKESEISTLNTRFNNSQRKSTV